MKHKTGFSTRKEAVWSRVLLPHAQNFKNPPSYRVPLILSPPPICWFHLSFIPPVSLFLSKTTYWEGIINNFKINFTKILPAAVIFRNTIMAYLKKLIIKSLSLIKNSIQQNCVSKLYPSAPLSCQKCFSTLILLCLPSICFALVFMHAACHPENEIVRPRENQKDQEQGPNLGPSFKSNGRLFLYDSILFMWTVDIIFDANLLPGVN